MKGHHSTPDVPGASLICESGNLWNERDVEIVSQVLCQVVLTPSAWYRILCFGVSTLHSQEGRKGGEL